MNVRRAIVVLALLLAAGEARAAGGAFAVDDAAVEAAGVCKVESILSASESPPADRTAQATPACSLAPFGHRAEFAAAFSRRRTTGEYSSPLTIKAKTPVPGLDFAKSDQFGVAVTAGYALDHLDTANSGAFFIVVPVTYRISDSLLFNLNIGRHQHRNEAESYTIWGTSLEFNLKPMGLEKFTLVGEIFGAGRGETASQFGIRFSPDAKIDIDVLFGHNLNGENANWLTLGLATRF